MERPETAEPRRRFVVVTLDQDVGLLHRVRRLRRRLPRRQRLRAAGRLPQQLRGAGLHLAPEGLLLQPPPRLRRVAVPVAAGWLGALQTAVVRLRLGWEVPLVQSLALCV